MADSNDAPQSGGGEDTAPPAEPEVKLENKPVEAANNEQKEAAEVKAEQEIAPAEPFKNKAEETVEQKPVQNTDQNANNVAQTETASQGPSSETDWRQREAQLLKKIEELEQGKHEKSEDRLLKVREEEIELLKARVKNLETELQAAMSKPGGGKNQEMIDNIKQQHDELLSKAKGMIFDKTKLVKNQELQIEALTTQIQSLKDINLITKDLLEIRNSEVKAMEERLEVMEAKFKAEKERFSLVLQRTQASTTINDDLRKEYETQLAIFKELRVKYDEKVKALTAENERLKNPSNQSGGAGKST